MQNKTALDYLIEAQDYITSMCNPNDRTEYQILKEINILIQKAINHLEKTSEQKGENGWKLVGISLPVVILSGNVQNVVKEFMFMV